MIWLGKRIAEGQIALMLLTRLPAGNIAGTSPSLAAARWAFPLAGLPVGLVIAGAYIGLSWLGLPVLLSAILALTAGVLTTGGLHEDGLADSADGFGGGHNRDRKLEIMKDSRIGSYGVLALIMVMSARVVALSSLGASVTTLLGIVAFAMASRMLMVGYLSLLPAARSDGLGRHASHDSGDDTGDDMRAQKYLPLIIAFLITAPALMAAYLFSASVLAAFMVMIIMALVMAGLAKRQIGGQTGDVCGAGQILSETAAWCALAALMT